MIAPITIRTVLNLRFFGALLLSFPSGGEGAGRSDGGDFDSSLFITALLAVLHNVSALVNQARNCTKKTTRSVVKRVASGLYDLIPESDDR
jgi:hypothetical protein